MGSQTLTWRNRIHINRPDRIINAADKQRMHQLFDAAGGIKSAKWGRCLDERKIKTPLVAKHRFGSRGTGVYILRNKKDVDAFLEAHKNNLADYIFEKFKPYSKEYRLHVWAGGIFYACRKALKEQAPKNDRWKMNDNNCVWYVESNPKFEKPKNWQEISDHCARALSVLELDVAGFDVRVDKKGNFFIIEVNSAPSFGTITTKRYQKQLPLIVERIRKDRGHEVY